MNVPVRETHGAGADRGGGGRGALAPLLSDVFLKKEVTLCLVQACQAWARVIQEGIKLPPQTFDGGISSGPGRRLHGQGQRGRGVLNAS